MTLRPTLTLLLVLSAGCGIFTKGNDDARPAAWIDPLNPRTSAVAEDALRVFVTRVSVRGDFAAHAKERSAALAADALCATEADNAGLDGRYVAYISTSGLFASERIVDIGPYANVTRKEIAYGTKAALPTPARAMDVLQFADGAGAHFAEYWSATDSQGNGDDRHCLNWTSAVYNFSGTTSSVLGDPHSVECNSSQHLLCVEQREEGKQLADKRVFISSKQMNGAFAKGKGDAFVEADTLCTSLAGTAGLPGEYVAWLSGTDASGKTVRAIDRIPEARYAMRNGKIVFPVPASLVRTPEVALHLDENGSDIATSVWTGTLASGAPSKANCSNWTEIGVTGAAGGRPTPNEQASPVPWSGPRNDQAQKDACYGNFSLVCFQR